MAKHRILPIRTSDEEVEELDEMVREFAEANGGVKTNRTAVIRAIMEAGKPVVRERVAKAREASR